MLFDLKHVFFAEQPQYTAEKEKSPYSSKKLNKLIRLSLSTAVACLWQSFTPREERNIWAELV